MGVATFVPLVLLAYHSIVTNKEKWVFNCESEIVAKIEMSDQVLSLDGIRGFFFTNQNSLQVNTALYITKDHHTYWYYRDITYKIKSYDDSTGIMSLVVDEITNHAQDNAPPEVMDNMILFHTSESDNNKYIRVKRVSPNYISIGDIYSTHSICLIK